jgi:nicotinamide phosphoribosyltransferase
MLSNIILNADEYKTCHRVQYPKNITAISAYIEARGGNFERCLFFGLQIFLKRYLTQKITKLSIEEAHDFFSHYGIPFARSEWEYILEKYDGYLPIEIEAIPEGTLLPIRNVLVQVVNTDPRCFWLTTYIETALLRAVWYPTTVATLSWHCKQVIKKYLESTSDILNELEHMLRDFGARGASSEETAGIGAAAHLVNFSSSSTLSGIITVRDFYKEKIARMFIPSSEHSTIISWGREHEKDAYEHILDAFSSNQFISIVCDSYNIWHGLDTIWGKLLKSRVQEFNGRILLRLDSGDPIKTVITALKKLSVNFGFSFNKKGYKVLPNYLRLIQGDGVSLPIIEKVLHKMKEEGFSAENIIFGMGGNLLQNINRDTLNFAMKVSAVKINEMWNEVCKTPISSKLKHSKKGRLALVKEGNSYVTIKKEELNGRQNLLIPVFRNGQILREYSFSEVRQNSENFQKP